MNLRPRSYKFKTNIRWVRARRGILSANNKKSIKIGCPPEFGGEPKRWTAEHLFIASIEICIMTTFKWLLEKIGGKIISYESEAVGMAKIVDGDFRFYEIKIKPVIIASDIYLREIKEAIENAHKQCLISKALNITVDVDTIIKTVRSRSFLRKGKRKW
jgi:organic hydroperoxide reductase OsmC/OhrA